MRGNLVADRLESLGAEIHAVHLVDDDGDLLDAEQMQQIAVPPGLVAHAFQRVDDQHRAVGLRRAGDHVAQKFRMAGRVDQHDVARRVRKRICVVSMVMPWSRSVCSASSRNDHSNGMPRRALTAFSISSLPSGRLPVSCSSRPTSVDLP